MGSWQSAERYIKGYIEVSIVICFLQITSGNFFLQDLEHWVNGWIDWNLVVDKIGGPNYAKNYVDAPIIINSTGNFLSLNYCYCRMHCIYTMVVENAI